MSVQVIGVQAVLNKIGQVEKQYAAATARGINKTAIDIQADAKKRVTALKLVDTGKLRASINLQKRATATSQTAIVRAAVNYAAFHEFGTSRMRARPFMVPAMEENKNKLKPNIAAFIRQV